MTNEQKYKTAEERDAAYMRFCKSHEHCGKCKLNSNRDASCMFLWLELEYKERMNEKEGK